MSDELPEYSPEDDVIPNFESDQSRGDVLGSYLENYKDLKDFN